VSSAAKMPRPRLTQWYECAGCRTGCRAIRPANAAAPDRCLEDGIQRAQWVKLPGEI
jgi:hypothetical protein